MALTFSYLASMGTSQPEERMNPDGPISLDEALAVGRDVCGRPQGEQRRRHVAHDAHVVAQDLLGLEDVGLAVQR